MARKIMVGVSTEQNTTNLIPAVQLEVSQFIIIETSIAHTKGWSNGLKYVLKERNICVEQIVLAPEEDNDIEQISQKIKEKIGTSTPVIWNVGGGQKPHQFAVWQTFQERKGNDVVCYANASTKKLETWHYKNDQLVFDDSKPTCVHLSAQEILTTFGYNISGKPELIYQRGKDIVLEKKTCDFMRYPEFREILFRLPANAQQNTEDSKYNITDFIELLQSKADIIETAIAKKLSKLTYKALDESNKKNIANAIKKQLFDTRSGELKKCLLQKNNTQIEIKNEELKSKIGSSITVDQNTFKKITKHEKAAIYFEQIIIQRVKQMLEEDKNHHVVEAYANLKVAKTDNRGEVTAEYDILCVTNKGTLFALDAKTFDFERKDSDARLYNLSQAGGRYVKFYPIIPYDPEDMDKDFFPKSLKSLPERLENRRMEFFVIADSQINTNEFTTPYCEKNCKILNKIPAT